MLRAPIVFTGLLLSALVPVSFTGSLGTVEGDSPAAGFATVFDFGYEDADSGTPITLIATGDSVTWLWTEGIHTVTHGVEGETGVLPPDFDSGIKRASDQDPTFSATFSTAGVYPYYCAVHPSMHGVVVVA